MRAASSLPVSGLAHSFEAATHSFSGTLRTTPSPASKIRSLRIFSSVLRIARRRLEDLVEEGEVGLGQLAGGDADVPVLLERAQAHRPDAPPPGS